MQTFRRFPAEGDCADLRFFASNFLSPFPVLVFVEYFPDDHCVLWNVGVNFPLETSLLSVGNTCRQPLYRFPYSRILCFFQKHRCENYDEW